MLLVIGYPIIPYKNHYLPNLVCLMVQISVNESLSCIFFIKDCDNFNQSKFV